jgi:hypothetical protein
MKTPVFGGQSKVTFGDAFLCRDTRKFLGEFENKLNFYG